MKRIFYFEIKNHDEDDRRLVYSASFVFLIMALIFAHLSVNNVLWKIMKSEEINKLKTEMAKENIYEVLVEQELSTDIKKEEIKALSDKDSAGEGGITEKEGFHTLTKFRELIFGGMIQAISSYTGSSGSKESNPTKDDIYETGIMKNDPLQKGEEKKANNNTNPNPSNQTVSSSETRIPANYRFQQDFLFRWSSGKTMTMATKKLAGFQYFKNMLRLIENNFAPPGGGNFAYRDMAGYMIREGIMPGETKVLFMLNDGGDVVDVKLMGSQGQDIVDRACMDSIRGQNFGNVPIEVKENGMIFGIRFIFPDIGSYR